MKTYILDSYAMLAYFRDEKGANEVEDLLVGAAEGKHLLMMTAINAGEVYYISVRKDGKKIAEKVWEALSNFPINIISADLDLALQSAKIKAEHKLSFADAFAASLSIRANGELVSGDKEFLNLSSLPGFKMKLIPI
jgi:ribonuclease VapC